MSGNRPPINGALIAVAVVVGLIEGMILGYLITSTPAGVVIFVLVALLAVSFYSDIWFVSDIAAFLLDLVLWPVRALGYAVIGRSAPEAGLAFSTRLTFWLAVAAATAGIFWANDSRIGGP